MWTKRIAAILLVVAAGLLGYFADDIRVDFGGTPFVKLSLSDPDAYKRGLDLNGGTHLLYRADTSRLAGGNIGQAMNSLRDVIERRVNAFGVSEPIVQVEEGGTVGGAKEERLIVELPGVTDVSEAIKLIGQTPLLEFRLAIDTTGIAEAGLEKMTDDELFKPTELTGQCL